jgi:hypothetical protein
LVAFEALLIKKMDDLLKDNASLKRVTARGPSSGRYAGQISDNIAMRSNRNNTAAPKGMKLNNNFSLPQILRSNQVVGRNSLQMPQTS